MNTQDIMERLDAATPQVAYCLGLLEARALSANVQIPAALLDGAAHVKDFQEALEYATTVWVFGHI